MHRTHRSAVVVCLLGLSVLAGCGQVFSSGQQPAETVTPAPLPEQPTERPEIAAVETRSNDSLPQSVAARYESLRPDCTRPPSLVIHVQVAALANNDPATNEGINTTWQFAAPSNRRAQRSYSRFVETITGSYQPLLNAESISYGPMTVSNESAQRRVTVASDGGTTTYNWRLRLVSSGRYDGCWMTVGVAEQREDNRFDDR